jgi:Sec-independent protein translocase protein TatA
MKFNLKNYVELDSKKKNMKIKDLVKSEEGLDVVGGKDLNMVVSFKLGKVVKQVKDELGHFKETLNNKVKELGEETKDKDGKPTGNWQVKSENMDEWIKQSKELAEEEVEISVPEIKLADIYNLKPGDITLSPSTLANLDWLICE